MTPVDRQAQLRAFLDAEDFFEDLALMPGAQDVLKQLSARFEIFIATQAMTVPNSLGPKYRWLQRHFPFIPPTHYVFCGNKSILRADYLIDDLPRNLLRFEGKGLLYTAPHNLTATGFIARQQLAGSGGVFCRGCETDASKSRWKCVHGSAANRRMAALGCRTRRVAAPGIPVAAGAAA